MSVSRPAAAALLWLALLAAACAPTAPPARLAGVAGDGLPLELTTVPMTPTTGLDQVGPDRAIELARARVHAQPTGNPRASLVRMSVRRPLDNRVLIEDRPVWLITFPGATFTSEPCGCVDPPPPTTAPTTAVALDPSDGVFVTLVGLP
jgi:hypothetical protein